MRFICAKKLRDALKAKTENDFPVIAGGTDLVVQWRSSGKFPEGVIDIFRLGELGGIRETADSIEIGALATHAGISGSSLIKKYLPSLASACGTVGSAQIRNRGTIGGNVMNASPAGDALPVLLAYDTQVELQSVRGPRLVPFEGFFTGYRSTVVAEDELVTRFIIKKAGKGERSVFEKIGTRSAQAISKVSACFRAFDGAYIISYGSVAPTPVRCRKTEGYLGANMLSRQIMELAVRSVRGEVAPIDDIRSDASYRRHVSGILLKRFLETLL